MGDQILTVVVSALVGGIVAFAGGVLRSMTEVRSKIDEKLYDKRNTVYPRAWRETEVLPRRPRTKVATYKTIDDLARELQEWYYREGGMFMSGGARHAYSDLQDEIEARRGGEPEQAIDEEVYEAVRSRCSTFRTMLTRDLLSRSRAPSVRRLFGKSSRL